MIRGFQVSEQRSKKNIMHIDNYIQSPLNLSNTDSINQKADLIFKQFIVPQSNWIGVSFGDSCLQSLPVSPPIDVNQHQSNADNILVRSLIFPRLIFGRPRNFVIIGKFSLISLIEFLFKYLLLTLNGEVLIVPPPIIEVIIVETQSFCESARCSQHIYRYYYKSLITTKYSVHLYFAFIIRCLISPSYNNYNQLSSYCFIFLSQYNNNIQQMESKKQSNITDIFHPYQPIQPSLLKVNSSKKMIVSFVLQEDSKPSNKNISKSHITGKKIRDYGKAVDQSFYNDQSSDDPDKVIERVQLVGRIPISQKFKGIILYKVCQRIYFKKCRQLLFCVWHSYNHHSIDYDTAQNRSKVNDLELRLKKLSLSVICYLFSKASTKMLESGWLQLQFY